MNVDPSILRYVLTNLDPAIFLPPKEARLLLGVGETRFAELYKSSQLPYTRNGRRLLFHRADLEAFANRVRGASFTTAHDSKK